MHIDMMVSPTVETTAVSRNTRRDASVTLSNKAASRMPVMGSVLFDLGVSGIPISRSVEGVSESPMAESCRDSEAVQSV